MKNHKMIQQTLQHNIRINTVLVKMLNNQLVQLMVKFQQISSNKRLMNIHSMKSMNKEDIMNYYKDYYPIDH